MKITVYVVVTYWGSNGDEIQVYGTRAEAEAAVLEYAADRIWQGSEELENRGEILPMPKTYAELCEVFDDPGGFDERWELEERTVEMPNLKGGKKWGVHRAS